MTKEIGPREPRPGSVPGGLPKPVVPEVEVGLPLDPAKQARIAAEQIKG